MTHETVQNNLNPKNGAQLDQTLRRLGDMEALIT